MVEMSLCAEFDCNLKCLSVTRHSVKLESLEVKKRIRSLIHAFIIIFDVLSLEISLD